MRLRNLREEAEWTQAYVAKQLNICQNTYSQYETGQRQLPIDVLIELAALYQTSTDYMLGLTNLRKPYPAKSSDRRL